MVTGSRIFFASVRFPLPRGPLALEGHVSRIHRDPPGTQQFFMNEKERQKRTLGLARSSLKLALYILATGLILVWVLAPENPSRTFRTFVLSLFAVAAIPFSRASWRSRLGEILGRRTRVLDILLVNLALFVAFGELGLRVIGTFIDSPLLAPPNAKAAARLRSWRGQPGQALNNWTLNAQGFLDVDFERRREAGTRRILALGDSFAVGVVPYAENFLTLLDEQLDIPGAAPTEVLNFGVAAIGPEDYLHLWRTEGAAHEPDLVLLCFFVGNDFRSSRPASLLYRESWLLFALMRRLAVMGRKELHQTQLREGVATFTPEEFRELERGRMALCQTPTPRRSQRDFDRTREVLEDLIETIGPRLRVAILPDEYQVNDELFARLIEDDALTYDRELPQRVLLELFDAHGVPCLDLLPALRSAEHGARTYKERDTHWNRRGNAVAATTLAEWLQKQGKERP